MFGDGRRCDVEMKMVWGEGLGLGFSRKCVDVVVPFCATEFAENCGTLV